MSYSEVEYGKDRDGLGTHPWCHGRSLYGGRVAKIGVLTQDGDPHFLTRCGHVRAQSNRRWFAHRSYFSEIIGGYS